MFDPPLNDLEEFAAYRAHPFSVHLHGLGYRSLLHLAAIFGTSHTSAWLEKVGAPMFELLGNVPNWVSAYCGIGNLNLREADGPELTHLTNLRRRRAPVTGWVSERSATPTGGAGVGLPVPVPPRPQAPSPPRADDWASPLPNHHTLEIACTIGDQGSRGTCVAFCVAALYFGAWRKAGLPGQILSVQYLYAKARERLAGFVVNGVHVDLRATDGTSFEAVLDVLRWQGACLESDLSYRPDHDFGQYHLIRPPLRSLNEEALALQAKQHRIKSYRAVAFTAEAVKRELFHGRAVGVGLPLYRIAWANPATSYTGVVPMPLTILDPQKGELLVDQPAGGHAVTIIGYQDSDNPGGGAFLFRNSWGHEWAEGHTQREGLGWLPYAYLERYAQAAYVIDELRPVP